MRLSAWIKTESASRVRISTGATFTWQKHESSSAWALLYCQVFSHNIDILNFISNLLTMIDFAWKLTQSILLTLPHLSNQYTVISIFNHYKIVYRRTFQQLVFWSRQLCISSVAPWVNGRSKVKARFSNTIFQGKHNFPTYKTNAIFFFFRFLHIGPFARLN